MLSGMRWNRMAESSQVFAAHTSLFCFTLLLLLKLDHILSYSWRIVFFPLFLFHVVVARSGSSLPGPLVSYGLYMASLRVPMLIVFELLLYAYLEGAYVSLKIVFLPLLAFEVAIFVDNFRMCTALLQEFDEILVALPHFCIAISMGFFFVGTVFTIRKLSGDTGSLSWWDVFLYFGIAECIVFLVCTKWCNPLTHTNSQIRVGSSSSRAIRYLDWNSDITESTEDISENRLCGLQDTVCVVMKILIVGFQILLCMHLEGKPAAARLVPLPVVFSPVLLVQGLGVLFATSNLVEKILPGVGSRIYFTYATRARDSLGCLQRGFRYNTFSDPPEIVKTLPKKDLTDEDDNLCKICFDREKNMVLLPCRHHILCRYFFYANYNCKTILNFYNNFDSLCLCSTCSQKCQKCPICRVVIKERLVVYDA
ncbi:putative transcription factor C2H2 family [Helianthus annuus]|nr:putative transcription factor C2H2 family [Helianthus annuus]